MGLATFWLSGWLGTAADLFDAVACGFFGQFGLDRLRTAVQPITSRGPK